MFAWSCLSCLSLLRSLISFSCFLLFLLRFLFLSLLCYLLCRISLVGCVGPFYKNLCTLGWFVVWSVKRIDILQVFRIGFLRSEPIYTSSFCTLIWNDYKLRKFSP